MASPPSPRNDSVAEAAPLLAGWTDHASAVLLVEEEDTAHLASSTSSTRYTNNSFLRRAVGSASRVAAVAGVLGVFCAAFAFVYRGAALHPVAAREGALGWVGNPGGGGIQTSFARWDQGWGKTCWWYRQRILR